MNLNATKSRLAGLTREISLRWQETQEYWRDAKGEEFDRRFLQELAPRVDQAAHALEKLEELLKKIGKECE